LFAGNEGFGCEVVNAGIEAVGNEVGEHLWWEFLVSCVSGARMKKREPLEKRRPFQNEFA
jgi:hypothetical protein